MIRNLTRTSVVLVVGALVLVFTFRSMYKDPNDFVLPGGVATRGDGYRVTATFANVENLVPNSKVMYNNVTIGTVTKIQLDGWQARVTMSLKRSVPLTRGATFAIAQQSLLGSEFVEVKDPGAAGGAQAAGRLRTGDDVTTDQTGNYPETEDVLSTVSLVLNGGGLSQLKTITTELSQMIGKPEQQRSARELIGKTNEFLAAVNSNKRDILRLIKELDRFARTFAEQRRTVSTAITRIRPALAALNDEREQLVASLEALGKFGRVGTRVINRTGDDLVSNLHNLQPVLSRLAEAREALPEALKLAGSFPFPLETIPVALRGDYANLFVTLDLTQPQLTANFLGGPADLSGDGMPSTAFEQFNPFLGPLSVSTVSKTKADTAPGAKPTTPGSGPATPTPSGAALSPSAAATQPPQTAPCNLIVKLLGGC